MRIIQLLPTLAYGDAISNDARAIKTILREWDPETRIYAGNIAPPVRGEALPADRLPDLGPEDVVLYHGSMGSKLNYRLAKMGGRKVMIYHNVTPPAFFTPYSSLTANATAQGLKEMRYLADKLDYCIADSEFNRQYLLRMGYTCPIDVCPILIPFADYEAPPDRNVLRRYENDGVKNLLFVGRITPNKRQEDIIRTFYFYRKYCEPRSRLILIGSWEGLERYYCRLCDYVTALGLKDSVILAGHLKFNAILAWYRLADAFVCMSEHEGFCVPLVEAMYFDVPVFARRAAAVPNTLGGSGVLLPDRDPAVMAACIDRVLRDDALRGRIVAGQRRRLADFSYERVSATLKAQLTGFLAGRQR